MVPAVQMFIVERLEHKYIDPPTFDLSLSYEDSSFFSPLIFVLSPGADPMASLFRFAEEKGKQLPYSQFVENQNNSQDLIYITLAQ